MAVAPIEVTLGGMTGYSLSCDLSPIGVDSISATIVLTEDTTNKCTYRGTTSAGLSGRYVATIKETATGTYIASGYVKMDDTTSIHRVVDYVADAIDGSIAVDTSSIATATATAVASEVFDGVDAIETGITFRKAIRAIAAILAGKITTAGSSTETFLSIGGTTVRVAVAVDATGNRTGVTLTL